MYFWAVAAKWLSGGLWRLISTISGPWLLNGPQEASGDSFCVFLRHGKFSYYHHHPRSGMITILFNWHGDRTKLKSVMLTKSADNKWTGFDYKGRVIHLTRIGHMEYDEATQLWSEVVVA